MHTEAFNIDLIDFRQNKTYQQSSQRFDFSTHNNALSLFQYCEQENCVWRAAVDTAPCGKKHDQLFCLLADGGGGGTVGEPPG